MSFLTRAAVMRLNDEGYLVVPPNDPRPLPIYDDETALRYVRNLGYTAIKTRLPPPPRVGTCWMPTRREIGGTQPTTAKPRWVRSVGVDAMSYAATEGGLPETISLRTWHRWKQKTRAVRV